MAQLIVISGGQINAAERSRKLENTNNRTIIIFILVQIKLKVQIIKLKNILTHSVYNYIQNTDFQIITIQIWDNSVSLKDLILLYTEDNKIKLKFVENHIVLSPYNTALKRFLCDNGSKKQII
jgi:hypothetical protein